MLLGRPQSVRLLQPRGRPDQRPRSDDRRDHRPRPAGCASATAGRIPLGAGTAGRDHPVEHRHGRPDRSVTRHVALGRGGAAARGCRPVPRGLILFSEQAAHHQRPVCRRHGAPAHRAALPRCGRNVGDPNIQIAVADRPFPLQTLSSHPDPSAMAGG